MSDRISVKEDVEAMVREEIEIIKRLQQDAGNVNYAVACAESIQIHVGVLVALLEGLEDPSD